MAKESTDLQKKQDAPLSNSERFTQCVLKEFRGKGGELQITDYQRQLVYGYFISVDRALKLAEEARMRKTEKYRDAVPVIWQNVNLPDLAVALVQYARVGLDMMQKNHLHVVPYKNNKTKQYDITLMPGYSGIEYMAAKYALEQPLDVTIELVHKTDTFKPLKKSRDIKVESYDFEIANPFNRGEIVGGFGYIEFKDPSKNKLIIMSIDEIEKRRPEKAAVEFWGGEKDVWENGQKVEKKTVEGWFAQMCYKTIVREVFSERHIPRDPKKVDDAYQFMRLQEIKQAQLEAAAEHDAHANKDVFPTDAYEVDPETGEIIEDNVNSGITNPYDDEGMPETPVGAAAEEDLPEFLQNPPPPPEEVAPLEKTRRTRGRQVHKGDAAPAKPSDDLP